MKADTEEWNRRRKHVSSAESMESVSHRRRRIVNAAQRHREVPLHTLHHHLDLVMLHEAYHRINPKATPGVDGQSWLAYGEGLTERLEDLLERVKSGRYKAQPVKRSYVPKNEKEKRPIGLPTIENKILERAVAMILEPIYELEFCEFSFGFRPGRSAHQALSYLRGQCVEKKVHWILEVDLRKYFDTVDHGWMMDLLRRRVTDKVITRLVGKWLKAGVWEQGRVSYPSRGTPQGGVISPLLSNIYLHEVLDKWFLADQLPKMQGESFLVRYADDFVMGFERLEDAQAMERALVERFAAFGLEVNEEKSRLVRFKRPSRYDSPGTGKPGSFDFLGFTVYWGRSKSGANIPKVKTSRSRFRQALERLKQWGWEHRHDRLSEQWKTLNEKLRGHDAYYGVTHNTYHLRRLRQSLQRHWRRWLSRRNRGSPVSWKQMNAWLRRHPLAPPRVHHRFV